MFGIGETELVIIVVFAFLLFGPDKLPGMGRTLGRMLRQFREASDGLTEVVQTSIMDPAQEELERSDKSPKQRRREAELEAKAKSEAEGSAEVTGSDGDEAGEVTTPPRRETFAERKARLMAERKAAEAAASVADDTTKAEAAEVQGPVAPGQAAVEAPVAETAVEAASVARTVADLYAMGSQHSSRYRASEQAAAVKDGVEAPVGAPQETDDGKGGGDER